MDLREIDVAFVLEGVPGVTAVHAIDGSKDVKLVVEVDGVYSLGQAYYSLLRVLTREECRAVEIVRCGLPSSFAPRARRLTLTMEQRAGAKARVPKSSPALEEVWEPRPGVGRPKNPRGGSALVVDPDPRIHRAAKDTFGRDAIRVAPSKEQGIEALSTHFFDAVLCSTTFAFGARGLLSSKELHPATRVILVAPEGATDLILRNLFERMETVADLEFHDILKRPPGRFELSNLVRRMVIFPPPKERVRERVVLIDESMEALALRASVKAWLDVVVATDVSQAHLAIATGRVALVLCSASLRTPEGALVYRELWAKSPELKGHMVLVTTPTLASSLPPPSAGGKPRPLVERPLTAAKVAGCLAELGRKRP